MKKILGVFLTIFASICFAQPTEGAQQTQSTQQTEASQQTNPTASKPEKAKPEQPKQAGTAKDSKPTELIVTVKVKTKEGLKPVEHPVIVDKYLSPYAGASYNMAIFDLYKAFDDRYLNDTQGRINWGDGLMRMYKLALDEMLAKFLMVYQHEVYGHGYRGREFGFSYLGYSVGIGSGWTMFSPNDYNSLSYPQRCAFIAGGMEATTILSQQIRNRWFKSGQVDRRDAQFYATNALSQPLYVYGTDEFATNLGNDVTLYIDEINNWHGSNVLSLAKLRDKSIWSLLDPSLFIATASMGTYIFESSAYIDMPMFNIKGYRYLPTPALLLAPYGLEFQLQNNIMTPRQEFLQVNLRYGKTGFVKSYGLDVNMDPIYKYRGFSFGNKLYLWNQPQFLKQNTAVGIKNSFGVADYITAEHKLFKNVSAYGEFGYKTAGYIPGNPLGNSWVWRVGASFKF